MKNLTIKSPDPDDLAAFEALKTSTGKPLTAAKVLGLLLSKPANPPGPSVTASPEYQAIAADLQQVNQQKTEMVAENATLKADLAKQQTRVTELEAQLLASLGLLEAAAQAQENLQVIPPAFVFIPKGKLLPSVMQTIQPFFYKKGFTKNQDPAQYNNELANYALRYFIENEFSKYLPAT